MSNHAASRVAGKFLMEQLRPARVMIKMPRYQRYINVAAFPDGLAVVQRFQHRQAPRIFLHLPRQRIQIFCALVTREFLPATQRCTCRLHRRVYVRDAALRHVGKFFSGCRITGLEIFSFQRRAPLAGNKMSESPLAGVQPQQGFLGIFRRRPVFHCSEFFDDAHWSLLIYAIGWRCSAE